MKNFNLHFVLFLNQTPISKLMIDYQKVDSFELLQQEPAIKKIIGNKFFRKILTEPLGLSKLSWWCFKFLTAIPLALLFLDYITDTSYDDAIDHLLLHCYWIYDIWSVFLLLTIFGIAVQSISNLYIKSYINKLKEDKIDTNYFEIFEKEINQFKNFKIYPIIIDNKHNAYGHLILLILLMHLEANCPKLVESYFNKAILRFNF